MNESNINVNSVIRKYRNKCTNNSALFKCGLCDHGTTQKHLLSTHMCIGTRFKCNQCDQIANQ